MAAWTWQVRVWWRTRDRRLLLQALPALVVGAVVLGTVTLLAAHRPEETQSHYLAQAKASFKVGDFATAMTCWERLAYADPHRPEIRFGLARTAEALGQVDRAFTIMAELAPTEKQGHALAHLWMARHLLSNPKYSKTAEAQLLRALDGELEDRDEAEGLLGELYFRAGNLEQAELRLSRAVKTKPQLHLLLARTFKLRGDSERFRWEADQAVSFCRAWALADLKEDRARLAWADAVLLFEDFPAAVTILEDGLQLNGNPAYRSALVRVYQLWSATLARDPKVDPGEQLKLLEKALRTDPSNSDLIMKLWAFTTVKGEAAEKARGVLRAQLASGKASGLVHLALGMDAWERGKQDEALVHLEQAYQVAPQLAMVANNLAWVLANAQPPDLERALTLINSVLKEWPNDAMCRDTRGQILFKMGKYKEALTDYQAALPVLNKEPGLHTRLAEVYDKLGLKEMAAEHQALAKKTLEERGKKP